MIKQHIGCPTRLILFALLAIASAAGAQTSAAADPSGAARATGTQILIEAVIFQIPARGSNTLGLSYLGGETQRPGNEPFGSGALSRSNLLSIIRFVPAAGTNIAASQASGFEYLAKPGTPLDVMVPMLADDSRVKILQRPRIQTSDGDPASVFVGESRPYLIRTGSGADAASSVASTQQVLIGVTFEVAPVVNPDGSVVMDIHQKIDRLAGHTNIVNVGQVPITSSTEARVKVQVRDRETILLGGLIETVKAPTASGVPLLGALFRSSTSRTERNEILVLLRSTSLASPESAAVPAKAKNE